MFHRTRVTKLDKTKEKEYLKEEKVGTNAEARSGTNETKGKEENTVPRQLRRPDQTNNLYLFYAAPYLHGQAVETLLHSFPVAAFCAFFSPYVREEVLCVRRILSHRVRPEGRKTK